MLQHMINEHGLCNYTRHHKIKQKRTKPSSGLCVHLLLSAFAPNVAERPQTYTNVDHTRHYSISFINLFAVLPCFTQRQNAVKPRPIRAGFELLVRSFGKGQSLRVALGPGEMEKCGQPFLLSCHWPCVI